jgi:hypothetical protein
VYLKCCLNDLIAPWTFNHPLRYFDFTATESHFSLCFVQQNFKKEQTLILLMFQVTEMQFFFHYITLIDKMSMLQKLFPFLSTDREDLKGFPPC